MQVKSNDFTSMKGHVADGCVVIAPSGKQFTIKSTMKGWQVLGSDNQPVTGNLPSAFDVEYFVVNGLWSH